MTSYAESTVPWNDTREKESGERKGGIETARGGGGRGREEKKGQRRTRYRNTVFLSRIRGIVGEPDATGASTFDVRHVRRNELERCRWY